MTLVNDNKIFETGPDSLICKKQQFERVPAAVDVGMMYCIVFITLH